MKVVVVFIGPQAPKYVFDNLLYLKRVIGVSPVLVTDNSLTQKQCYELGIDCWLAPKAQSQLEDVYRIMKHPKDFREGFWFNTFARFSSLESYMKEHPDISVLQIEADVWISKLFPFEKFRDLNVEISFGLETASTGSAALLYLSNGDSASKLVDIVRTEFAQNSSATDMTILGQIHKKNLMDHLILPSVPKNYPKELINTTDASFLHISQHIDYFGGVFDPITIGQYLTGVDAKNNRGIRNTFQKNTSHNFSINATTISLENGNPVVITVEESTLLFSIHNHGKNRKLFHSKKYVNYLERQVRLATFGPRKEFQFGIFVKALRNSTLRRLGKINAK